MTYQPRLGRRGLLTLAGLAALPAACSRPAPVVEPLVVPTTTPAAAPSTTPPVRRSPSPSVSATPSRSPSPVPSPSGRVMVGSYLALSGRTLTGSLALRRRQLGREQRIVHVFHPWAGRMPTAMPEIGRSTLMLSWHGTRIATITNGSQDRIIRSAARRLAKYGRPMLLRWAWEMNGSWFEWDGTHNGKDPSAYASAYRRIHRIFREEGADNVAFVWSPNWNSGPDEPWNRMERYYPGDEYVDWVGVSGYDFSAESPATLFRHVVSTYGARKPIVLSETAAIDHGGESKAKWISALSAYVKRTPSIGAVVWFDTDVQHDSEHNFRFDTSEEALAAYRTMVRGPHFSA
jgi:hypothetical protein